MPRWAWLDLLQLWHIWQEQAGGSFAVGWGSFDHGQKNQRKEMQHQGSKHKGNENLVVVLESWPDC